ncbi:hypothetical protein C8J56DRAFT_901494 [Mycena floridula]|nr:hypothetical protein C8J56DRAFT_901494 [Mycena floridula]
MINDELRDERDEEPTASPTNASETSSLPILTPSPSTASQVPIIPALLANSAIVTPIISPSRSNSPSNPPTPNRQASPHLIIASPDRNYSSGDSSDEEAPRTNIAMSQNESRYAELIQQSSSKCCEVTDGELTLQLIHDFIRKQKNWFVAKDIKAADQAKRSFVAFSNNRKLDKYIDNNNARLAVMEFEPFVADLQGYALEEDWTKKVLTELMSKKLRRGASFATHSQDVVYLNRLLEGTAEHQTDIQMRSHVTASLPSELHEHAFSIVAATYDEWSGALVKLIKKHHDLGKRLALANPTLTATIQNATPSTLQPAFQYSNQNHQLNQNQHLTPFTNARSSMPYPNQNALYASHSNFPSSQQHNQEHPQQWLSGSLWATSAFQPVLFE